MAVLSFLTVTGLYVRYSSPSSSFSIGTVTLVGFGLLNYR